MKRLSLVLCIIFFSFSTSGQVNGREPAVEPVVGLSINSYPEIPAEKSRGFDFSDGSPTIIKNSQRVLHPIPIGLAVVTMLLPVGLWYFMRRTFRSYKHNLEIITGDKDRDMDYKKAS